MLYPAYLIFVNITLLLPGYVFVRKLGYFKTRPGLGLILGYLLTIVFMAVLAAADYALRLSPTLTRAFEWLVIVSSLVVFIKERYYRDLWELRFPIICMMSLSLISLIFISLPFSSKFTFYPDPQPLPTSNYKVLDVKVLNIAQTQANDNSIPYRQAQFFINRSNPAQDSFISEWGVGFFQRTPLMGSLTANYFNLLGDKPPIDLVWSNTSHDVNHTFLKFQVIASVLNALFIIPAFFLLTKLFKKKTAIVSCLFFVSSQYFIYNNFFSWPKSFVAFFILFSWLLLLEEDTRLTILAGAVSGIAYLTHDLAVLYIGASFLLLLVNKRFKETFLFGVSAFAFALPWLFLTSVHYRKTSSFILYPISLYGIPQPTDGKLVVDQFMHASPFRILMIRASNLAYMFSPFQLFTSEGGQTVARRLWGLGLYSITGATGLGLMIPLALGALKKLRDLSFWVLALTPVLMATLVIGWPKGLAALHFAEAVVVLLSGLGVWYLVSLKQKIWLLVAFLINSLQLVFFVTYSFGFHIATWLTSLTGLIHVGSLLLIVGGSGYLVHRASHNKTIWIG